MRADNFFDHSFGTSYFSCWSNPKCITDGAWESQKAGAGAVVFDPDSGRLSVSEIKVPDELVNLWLSDTGDQIISQIEMFAALCTRCKFSERLVNRVDISWIDNESAKFACIKGTSTSFSMQPLCRVMQQIEIEKPSTIWYERVASHSNPGDRPPRQQTDRASALFNSNVEAAWVPPTNLVDAIVMLHNNPYGVIHALLTGEQTSATNTNKGEYPSSQKVRVSSQLLLRFSSEICQRYIRPV